MFERLMQTVPRPLRILDVGGEQLFWERMGVADQDGIQVVVYNLFADRVSRPNFQAVQGDARRMSEFRDNEFDIVFSNSVIEHVGSYDDQRQMALEIRRVGKRMFVQTPSRYFPIEPHFLVPFFQFFPLWLKVFFIRKLDITYARKQWSREEAVAVASEIRLLTAKELRQLFPGAHIARERILGSTKSFMVYDGWEAPRE